MTVKVVKSLFILILCGVNLSAYADKSIVEKQQLCLEKLYLIKDHLGQSISNPNQRYLNDIRKACITGRLYGRGEMIDYDDILSRLRRAQNEIKDTQKIGSFRRYVENVKTANYSDEEKKSIEAKKNHLIKKPDFPKLPSIEESSEGSIRDFKKECDRKVEEYDKKLEFYDMNTPKEVDSFRDECFKKSYEVSSNIKAKKELDSLPNFLNYAPTSEDEIADTIDEVSEKCEDVQDGEYLITTKEIYNERCEEFQRSMYQKLKDLENLKKNLSKDKDDDNGSLEKLKRSNRRNRIASQKFIKSDKLKGDGFSPVFDEENVFFCKNTFYVDSETFNCSLIENTMLKNSGNKEIYGLMAKVSLTENPNLFEGKSTKDKCIECFQKVERLMEGGGLSPHKFKAELTALKNELRSKYIQDNLSKFGMARKILKNYYKENKTVFNTTKDSFDKSFTLMEYDAKDIYVANSKLSAEEQLKKRVKIREDQLLCNYSEDILNEIENFKDENGNRVEGCREKVISNLKEIFPNLSSLDDENVLKDIVNKSDEAINKIEKNNVNEQENENSIAQKTDIQLTFLEPLKEKINKKYDALSSFCYKVSDVGYNGVDKIEKVLEILYENEKSEKEKYYSFLSVFPNYAPLLFSADNFCSYLIEDTGNVGINKEFYNGDALLSTKIEEGNILNDPYEKFEIFRMLSEETCLGGFGKFLAEYACGNTSSIPKKLLEGKRSTLIGALQCEGYGEGEKNITNGSSSKPDGSSSKPEGNMNEKFFSLMQKKSTNEIMSSLNEDLQDVKEKLSSNPKFKLKLEELKNKALASLSGREGKDIKFDPKLREQQLADELKNKGLLTTANGTDQISPSTADSKTDTSSNASGASDSSWFGSFIGGRGDDKVSGIKDEVDEYTEKPLKPYEIQNQIQSNNQIQDLFNQLKNNPAVSNELSAKGNDKDKEGTLKDELEKSLNGKTSILNNVQDPEARKEIEKLKQDLAKSIEDTRKSDLAKLDQDQKIKKLEEENKKLSKIIEAAKVTTQSSQNYVKNDAGFLSAGTSVTGFNDGNYQTVRTSERKPIVHHVDNAYVASSSDLGEEAKRIVPTNLSQMVKNRSKANGGSSNDEVKFTPDSNGNLSLTIRSGASKEAIIDTKVQIEEVILDNNNAISQVLIYGSREPVDIVDLDDESKKAILEWYKSHEGAIKEKIENNNQKLAIAKKIIKAKKEVKNSSGLYDMFRSKASEIEVKEK